MWVYACIQRMMFLEPRITKHSFYLTMLDTLKSDPSLLFLVRMSLFCLPQVACMHVTF